MLTIIPENQTETGWGKKVIKGRNVDAINERSLQFVFLNSDDTEYTGINNVTLSVYISNIPAKEVDEIKYLTKISEITLDATNPTYVLDAIGQYRNIIVSIDSIIDGKVTVFHFPEYLNTDWD